MFKNYFKIAFRSLWKNKGYSTINILGLAVGLATCLVIILYVVDEISYDRFYKNAGNVYRINSDIKFGGSNLHFTQTSDMMGQLLKKDYPQIEEYTRIYNNNGSKLLKKGADFIDQQRVAHVDSTFFRIFDLPVIDGNTRTALDEPKTVVLTESAAKKYFNDVHVVGKTIEEKDGESTRSYKVTAVIKDIPHNSHLNFEFFFSMKNVNYQWGQLTSHNFQTFLLLRNGTDYKAFQKNFVAYIDKYVLPEAKAFMNINSMDEFRKAGNYLDYNLIPLTKIHLYSDYNFEITPPGNIQYVYIFGAVALFILLIACINFINLSTARSANRAKEVGIRKTLGTERSTLITQFLVESTLTVIISLLIAIGITWLMLPLFNNVAGKSIHINEMLDPRIFVIIVLLPFVVGILAGSYPAVFLSKFNPITVLKGNSNTKYKKSNLRNVLVIIQFTTSIILIIGTIVVYKQLNYIQTKKLGFNKDQVLVINGTGSLGNSAKAFKDDVLAMSGVKSGTLSFFLPVTSSARNDNTYSKDAVMDSKNGIGMQTWTVDYDYIKTMGMEIIKGRNFSKEFADSNATIINETTAKFLGYDDPIGKKIYTFTDNNGSKIAYNIIGVVKNFNFESLRENIGPLCMRLGTQGAFGSFKIEAGKAKNLIAQVESKWKTMSAGLPFSYRFLDDSFDDMYRNEQRIGKLAISFAILAIFVACLGLFGLATYMAEQRTKEIGIRKVLGASVGNVVNMLSKDFIILVLISSVFAFPIAWWAMHNWLEDFVYRINIGWWIFIAAGAIAFLIAFITVSSQAIKAALANPVKSLRTE